MTPAKVLDNARICSFQQPCESFAAWQSAHSKWEREPTTVQRGCSHCNIDGLARLPADEVFHSSAVVKDERELASPSSLDYTDIFTRPGINRTWLMQRCRTARGLLRGAHRGSNVTVNLGDGESLPLAAVLKHGWDAAVLRSFFTDRDSGRPLAALGQPTYLELGGGDGEVESTTLVFDRCLNWTGVLVEASPASFEKLLQARPNAVKINAAVCEEYSFVPFTASGFYGGRIQRGTTTAERATGRHTHRAGSIQVPCVPLDEALARLAVRRLDFFSLDCEGCELSVINTLARALGRTLSLGARGDGHRAPIFRRLLRAGMSYAGMIAARGTTANHDSRGRSRNVRYAFPYERSGCLFRSPGYDAELRRKSGLHDQAGFAAGAVGIITAQPEVKAQKLQWALFASFATYMALRTVPHQRSSVAVCDQGQWSIASVIGVTCIYDTATLARAA
ncbi:hypothetical protein EMIHUDRAFT_245599 [Emiliania huxleyi CCMP1516]|uniref:Methyltransferase FkbM domain-containing protein n=2 Tax=Emiliania huxleyi TaxID=2903 RepID=A0A0D3IX05_EMIH1|nr:hypothetical protein EMIHUDRAFT_245599 [Emiliania huxleyi CCMP1516]EOD15790.1 hypothetical protein EMIHUDRAFT_245599 [Emiliania huxleyi CCMP1516]|eukprot:XP_005768219.1 hypothetical protein EMIHUDRAFT_245599 [Emiliania huxleyi CCMP1516]